MKCRDNCGACCISPSITSPIPGMLKGKPENTPCIHLDDHFLCRIFHDKDRPAVCKGLKPSIEMCRNNREEALQYLKELEEATRPELE